MSTTAYGPLGMAQEDGGAAIPRRWLLLAHLACAGLGLAAVALFVVSIPALYSQLGSPPPELVAALARAGVPVTLYAAYLNLVNALFGLVCFSVAALIVWRKPMEKISLVAALALVLMGAVNAANAPALEMMSRLLVIPVEFMVLVMTICLTLFLYVFPDGRFVPHWTRYAIAALAFALLLDASLLGDSLAHPTSLLYAIAFLSSLLVAAVAQVYRYLRVSGPLARQQTKWVVAGVLGAVLGQIVFGPLSVYLPSFVPPGLRATPYDPFSVTSVSITYSLIPITVGVAILRYRLWDIDLILNRALVYGSLTGIVAGLYMLVAGGLGTLLQANGNLFLSLLAAGLVAVLFAPLRDRLQRGVNRLMYGDRDEPYRLLSRLGERLEGTLAPDAVLPAILQTVRDGLKLPYAALWTLRDDTLVQAASAGTPTGNTTSLPLLYQGEMMGQLELSLRGGTEGFSQADHRLLNDLARQAGIAVHAVMMHEEALRLAEDLQRSRERLIAAREEERRRLRRDLHDGLGPALASQALTLEAIRKLIATDPRAAQAMLDDLTTHTQMAIEDIRHLVYALRPPALDELGLLGALREQAVQYERNGLGVVVLAPDPMPALPAAVEVAAYRICMEAVTNVIRHAGATRCTIELTEIRESREVLRLTVQDDGRGLPADAHRGVGLASMRERAMELGGECVVEATPGGGTRVAALLPLPEG